MNAITTPELFPAHAGMNRHSQQEPSTHGSVPRARGDEPVLGTLNSADAVCSPRTRG